jgi:hypothetical protein
MPGFLPRLGQSLMDMTWTSKKNDDEREKDRENNDEKG